LDIWQVGIPLVTTAVSLIFAGLVWRRWLRTRHAHELVWGAGLILFGTGALMEALHALGGWNPVVFRLWYLCGAALVAAWLGQGTAYLLMRGKLRPAAHLLMALLMLGSIFAAYRVGTAQLDPARVVQGGLSGSTIVSGGVRTLTPLFNVEGVLLLVGGALYSALHFYRRRRQPHRVAGNLLVAAGALFPAVGGGLQRAGIPVALYLSELIGVTLIFAGFLFATRSSPGPATSSD
jgi:hypothetical protein